MQAVAELFAARLFLPEKLFRQPDPEQQYFELIAVGGNGLPLLLKSFKIPADNILQQAVEQFDSLLVVKGGEPAVGHACQLADGLFVPEPSGFFQFGFEFAGKSVPFFDGRKGDAAEQAVEFGLVFGKFRFDHRILFSFVQACHNITVQQNPTVFGYVQFHALLLSDVLILYSVCRFFPSKKCGCRFFSVVPAACVCRR